MGPIPIGHILTSRTRWSQDDNTSKAREQLDQTLQHSGAAILDAHISQLDIVVAGALLSQIQNVEAVVAPVAGYLYYAPYIHTAFFEKLNRYLPVQAMPVFRGEEQGKGSRKLRNRSGLSLEEMKRANDRYLVASKAATQSPHQLSVIAPYGTRDRASQRLIRGGVAEILQSGCPALCTLAMFDWKSLKYVVGMSQLLPEYDARNDREEMTADISRVFSALKDSIR